MSTPEAKGTKYTLSHERVKDIQHWDVSLKQTILERRLQEPGHEQRRLAPLAAAPPSLTRELNSP